MFGNTRLKFGISRAMLLDRAYYARFTKNACANLAAIASRKCNTVLLHFDGPIASSQFYPFIRYRDELQRRYGLTTAHIDVENYVEMTPNVNPNVTLICLQTWFDVSRDDMDALLTRTRADFPNAALVYFDWFAPADLRMVELLDERIDLYVKKNLLKDRSLYRNSHAGDTNLSDYYGALYDLEQPTKQYDVSDDWWSRILLGPGFISSPYIEQLISLPRHWFDDSDRALDLQSRIGGGEEAGWYGHSRRHANSMIESLSNMKVAPSRRVSRRKYLQEIAQAKMTFSPFGYGEICWRDFEAFALGAVLIKPAVNHLLCSPELFIEDETYVPVKWDFSDLGEKVEELLDEPERLQDLRNRAHSACVDYVAHKRGADFVGELLNRLARN